jgi:hypothetical protein
MNAYNRGGQGLMNRLRYAITGLVALLALAFVVSPAVAQQDPAKVYYIEADGWYGKDITFTPLNEAFEEARTLGADYLIIKVDVNWHQRGDPVQADLPDDSGIFDIFGIRPIRGLFTDEGFAHWEKKPKVVFWVKNAMGSAAFLPFLSDTMFFDPDGRIGGIRGVYLRYQQGDEVVKEKLVAASMATAKGMVIDFGYEPKLIEAMARGDYVLSYRLEGGRPVYLERMPQSTDEFLLTNDALDDSQQDTIAQLARGEGTNWLTLRADVAQVLGVSKGTAKTLDDVLFELGIARNHEMIGNGNKIMDDWSDSVKRTEDALVRLWREYREIQVGSDDWNERRRARGQQRAKLQQMIGLLERFEEAIVPWQIPGFIQAGSPGQVVSQFRLIIQRLDLEQLADER